MFGIFVKVVGSLILLAIFLLILFIMIKGKGKPIKLMDENGERNKNYISTREKITINGSEQYIFITSENKHNPVLLFLHGGPGSPEVGLHDFKVNERLEQRFTVCYWEQRGAGLSYNARLSPHEMTLDVMIEDTIIVTKYLMKKFDKHQIYLMGHSWGSYLGIKTIQKYPKYFTAFFGIGQISNQKQSEKLAYDYMKQHAQAINDKKAVEALEKFDSSSYEFPTNDYVISIRTKYMNKYGIGIEHKENLKMIVLLKKLLMFRGYSVFDFVKFGLGNISSVKAMNHLVMNENLMETSKILKVPVYILQGKYDYQVSHALAKEYYDMIQAPNKAFYSFENSAHSPNFEETRKFLDIVFSLANQHENSAI